MQWRATPLLARIYERTQHTQENMKVSSTSLKIFYTNQI